MEEERKEIGGAMYFLTRKNWSWCVPLILAGPPLLTHLNLVTYQYSLHSFS